MVSSGCLILVGWIGVLTCWFASAAQTSTSLDLVAIVNMLSMHLVTGIEYQWTLPFSSPIFHRFSPMFHGFSPIFHGSSFIFHGFSPNFHRLSPIFHRSCGTSATKSSPPSSTTIFLKGSLAAPAALGNLEGLRRARFSVVCFCRGWKDRKHRAEIWCAKCRSIFHTWSLVYNIIPYQHVPSWLVVWNTWIMTFHILGIYNHPNWRTPSFFRGVGIPPSSLASVIHLTIGHIDFYAHDNI